MEVTFGDCELTMPEEHGGEWEARHGPLTAHGETAADALYNLGLILDDVVESAEYYRVHAPGVYGHQTDSSVPQGDNRDHLPVPEGERGEEPAPIHQDERPKDRL